MAQSTTAASPKKWARTWSFDADLQMRSSRGTVDTKKPVAAFDFDGTLEVFRKSGPSRERTLPILKKLADTHNLVMFSNRSTKSEENATPIIDYVEELDRLMGEVPHRISVYMSTAYSRCRKPMTGMWEQMVYDIAGVAYTPEGTLQENTRTCLRPGAFYCGDAAGRPGDFSDSDYRFALNIRAVSYPNLTFATPEVLFGSASWDQVLPTPPRPTLPVASTDVLAEIDAAIGAERRYCVVMVGAPASGKSTVVKRLVERVASRADFVMVSNDIQKSGAPKLFARSLSEGKSVVVDNTNPRRQDRAMYAEKAARAGYAIIVCHVTTPHELCVHLNGARVQSGKIGVPLIAMHSYRKRFELIEADELAEFNARLVEIPFAVDPASHMQELDLYYC